MSGRLVILSDTHLGRTSCCALSASALRPLWQDADRLVLNGDVAEIHHPKHWALAAQETLQLLDLCDQDNVALTLLSGNHDPYLSDTRHLHLAGGSVFVTHGDALHPAIAPWSPAAARLRKAHREAIASLEPESREHLESMLAASQHASHAEWEELTEEAGHSSIRGMLFRPWAIVHVLLYWREFPRLASTFVGKHAPDARFIIIGHTHRPGIWDIDGRTIINTGSYGFPGTPRAVVVEGNQLTVRRVIRNGDVYEYAPDAVAQYELPHVLEGNAFPQDSARITRPVNGRPSAAAM